MNRLFGIQDSLAAPSPPPQRMGTQPSDADAIIYPGKYPNKYSSQKAAPALFGIAGLTAVEAASLGLGVISELKAVAAKSGSLTIRSDQAQRLLTPQARLKLNKQRKRPYTRKLLYIGADTGFGGGIAHASLEVTWEGNAYGEIGSAYVRRNLSETKAFSKSSLNVSFTKLNKIPPSSMKDPREWPITFGYDGSYDPWGNGQFEFQGEFQINAFGGLKFLRHEVKSVSLADWAIAGQPTDYVIKQRDYGYTVPSLPADQRKYLLANLPK